MGVSNGSATSRARFHQIPEKPALPDRESRSEEQKCLLCQISFRQRSSLTRHFRAKHLTAGIFDRTSPCPECCRPGGSSPSISSRLVWRHHIAEAHGKIHAPAVKPGIPNSKKAGTQPISKSPDPRPRQKAGNERKRHCSTALPNVSVLYSQGLSKDAASPPPAIFTSPSSLDNHISYTPIPASPPLEIAGVGRTNGSDTSSTSSDDGGSCGVFSQRSC
jgi:hypothetical protein